MSTRNLPVELWTQIFEHFQLNTRDYEGDLEEFDIKVKRRDDFISLDTLRSICLVSKTFHRTASPILYRVFPFTSDSLEFRNHATSSGESRDELYLQTLHRNPAYADALRFIYMDVSRPLAEYCIDCVPASRPTLPPALTSNVDSSCYVLQPASRIKRVQGTEAKQGLYEYFLALVLLMCRNVQGMHLATPNCEYPESSLLDEALSLAAVELPSLFAHPLDLEIGRYHILQKLRTITVAFSGDCPDASFQGRTHPWLFRALQSGSLETLTLRKMFWYSLDRPGFNFIPMPTRPLIGIHLKHLTTLRLLEYGAGGSLIGSLVESCPSLTVLEVIWAEESWSRDYFNEAQSFIAFDLIAAAIANHAPNLSTLILDDSQQGYVRSFALPQHTFGRHLRDMRNLRTIRASESAFYTDKCDECILEALPKCLESLSIVGAGGYNDFGWAVRHGSLDGRALRGKQDADLRYLLQSTSLPHLRRVCVNFHSYIDKPVSVQIVLTPQLVWTREPRDIYNDDIADNGWELCDSAEGDATRELIRPFASDINAGGL